MFIHLEEQGYQTISIIVAKILTNGQWQVLACRGLRR